VTIDLGIVLKSTEANPTNVCVAHRAMHVLATFVLVDENFAVRAFLRAVTRCPLSHELPLFSWPIEHTPICAGKKTVSFRVASSADGDRAGGASEVFGSPAAAIGLRATRGDTTTVLIGVLINVYLDHLFEELLELERGEKTLNDRNSNPPSAFALVTHTNNRAGIAFRAC